MTERNLIINFLLERCDAVNKENDDLKAQVATLQQQVSDAVVKAKK